HENSDDPTKPPTTQHYAPESAPAPRPHHHAQPSPTPHHESPPTTPPAQTPEQKRYGRKSRQAQTGHPTPATAAHQTAYAPQASAPPEPPNQAPSSPASTEIGRASCR